MSEAGGTVASMAGGDQIANWIVALIGAGSGIVLTQAREAYRDWTQSRKRKRVVRRLLAHHAATLADDAAEFVAITQKMSGADDAEIARGFADASSFEHVYRDQIANRLDDLSDELITLFKDLDLASAASAQSVSRLQRWSSAFFDAREVSRSDSGTARTLPDTLANELRRATVAHALLLNFARDALRWLRHENTELPDHAVEQLEAPNLPLPPGISEPE
jgi:hypothetical protein